MKKIKRVMKTLLAVSLIIQSINPVVYASNQPSHYWQLVQVLQNDWQTRLENENKALAGTSEYGMAVSNQSVVFTRTYTGKDGGPYGDGWQRTGMSETGEVSWSAPSLQKLTPDDTFELTLSVKHLSSDYKYPGGNWMVLAQLYNSDSEGKQTGGASTMMDENGVAGFTSGAGNNFESYQGTIVSKLGSGYSEGEYKTVRVIASCGVVSLETSYIYQWTTNTQPTTTTNNPSTISTTEPVTSAEGVVLIPSGIIFADLYGEVSVKHAGEDDSMYEFAEIGMVLYEGDVIRTRSQSGATLSFADLSTFVMKEESIIILDVANDDYQTKRLKLIAGKVLANVKKMVTDGTMDVEMSQGVSGIKGTVFVCEELDGTSTLKVLEGSVDWTPHNDVLTTNLLGTELISLSSDGEVVQTTFDITEELNTWPDSVKNEITATLLARGVDLDEGSEEGSSPLMIIVTLGVIGSLAIAGRLILKSKRNS